MTSTATKPAPSASAVCVTRTTSTGWESAPGSITAADFKVEPEGATPTADLDGAAATASILGANYLLVLTLSSPTTSGTWSTAGEIDLDTFTHVADNAAVPNAAVENGVLTEVPISGLDGVSITARETIDSDADGQIDRIRLVASEAVNDLFTGFSATVAGYTVTGTDTGSGATDAEFFLLLTELATPDTAATPAVQITSSGSLRDLATGTKKIIRDAVGVAATDTAAPVLVGAKKEFVGAIGTGIEAHLRWLLVGLGAGDDVAVAAAGGKKYQVAFLQSAAINPSANFPLLPG